MSRKLSKIDSESSYPCPCRKQGQLCPIALTEALGCSQCNDIFVVRPDGYTLEKVSGAHPYKQLWYWTGKEWTPVRPPLQENGCAWVAGAVLLCFVLLLCLPWILHIPFDRQVVVWMVLTISIAVALSFMVWLVMHRRP